MDVGSDYLLSRDLTRRRWKRGLGFSLLGVGAILLVAGASYYAYAGYARSQLSDLEVITTSVVEDNEKAEGVEREIGSSIDDSVAFAIPASRFTRVYPGQDLHPKYWTFPYWAETYRPPGWALIQNFEAVSPENTPIVGSLGRSVRVQIPAIGLDSDVAELRIIGLGDSRTWETPKNLVGHIPSTPNAGEGGRAYFFGHLESPLLSEGNIFSRLPEIPGLLRQGEEVYILFTNSVGDQYLYKVFETIVVGEDDLTLDSSTRALASLVACVPRLVYDHRLVVTGELVGIKRG